MLGSAGFTFLKKLRGLKGAAPTLTILSAMP
jgi:hypothetical protein